MLVSSIKLNNINSLPVINKKYSVNSYDSKNYSNVTPAKIYNNNYNIVSFKSNQISLFNNLLCSNSTSKIYQYLCENKKASPNQVREFLDKVLANDNLAKSFIQEITQEPRKSAETVINLIKRLGGEENFRDWYFAKGGYRESFGKYLGNYYFEANNLDKLLMLMPNWKLSDIVAKYHKSTTGDVFKGGDPLIGSFPEALGNHSTDLPHIINHIQSSKYKKAGDIYIQSRKLEYEVLKDADDKLVCKIKASDKNKQYIIKIDKIYSDYIYSRLRANSVYIEAIIGKFLTANYCKDVPKFHFYDFFHNAAIFDYVQGNNLKEELNPIRMNQLTPDLLALGIRTNDTHISNYLQTNDGFVNLDLGNATYFDILKPGDICHTICLPSYTGLDFSNTYSPLNFVKFIQESQKKGKICYNN